MKAVAFEKLSMFITWPAGNQKSDMSHEFVIAVYGQNPFGDMLEKVYENKKIKDKKVKIVYINNIKQLNECQILFIADVGKEELKKVLGYVKDKPVLTISDSEGYAEAGCFINYYIYESKLRFEINQKAMQDARFIIDYRLLRVSKIINPTIE
ncbi:MAG: YfiR family protein [Bacteroidetes bacterium]|nr:YfiR family protein [Bacteroidota bacterium]